LIIPGWGKEEILFHRPGIFCVSPDGSGWLLVSPDPVKGRHTLLADVGRQGGFLVKVERDLAAGRPDDEMVVQPVVRFRFVARRLAFKIIDMPLLDPVYLLLKSFVLL